MDRDAVWNSLDADPPKRVLVLPFRSSICSFVGILVAKEVEAGSIVGSRKFGGFGKLLNRSRSGHFRKQLEAAVVFQASASRDETAHDDVFLEAPEVVHLAGNCGFGKDARGLLEARGRDEGIGRERGLGDAEEQRASSSGTATFGDDAVVLLTEAEFVHLFLEEEGSVANVFNLDPTHHLTRDSLDVFVVDVDALKAVDLLNGVNEVSLGVFFAENRQQVVEVERTVDERLAGADVLAFLDVDVNAAWDGVFLGGFAIIAFDVDLAHALADFAVTDVTIDLADDRGILGLAGFEEFNDARQTAGDVFGLGGFARDLRENVASLNFVTILDHQVSARRHEVLLADLAGRIADQDGGLMFFIARRKRDDKLR